VTLDYSVIDRRNDAGPSSRQGRETRAIFLIRVGVDRFVEGPIAVPRISGSLARQASLRNSSGLGSGRMSKLLPSSNEVVAAVDFRLPDELYLICPDRDKVRRVTCAAAVS
jgi:hypothetical protein